MPRSLGMSTTCLQWSPLPAEGLGLTPLGADVVSSSPELRLLSERSSPLREELVETVTYMYYKHSAIGWMDGFNIGYRSSVAIKSRETNLFWSSSCCTFLPLPLPRPVMLLSSNLIQGSTHRLLCNNSKSKLGSMREVLVHPYNIIVNKLSGYRGVIF